MYVPRVTMSRGCPFKCKILSVSSTKFWKAHIYIDVIKTKWSGWLFDKTYINMSTYMYVDHLLSFLSFLYRLFVMWNELRLSIYSFWILRWDFRKWYLLVYTQCNYFLFLLKYDCVTTDSTVLHQFKSYLQHLSGKKLFSVHCDKEVDWK